MCNMLPMIGWPLAIKVGREVKSQSLINKNLQKKRLMVGQQSTFEYLSFNYRVLPYYLLDLNPLKNFYAGD